MIKTIPKQHLNKVFDETISSHDTSYHGTYDKFIFNNRVWGEGGVEPMITLYLAKKRGG